MKLIGLALVAALATSACSAAARVALAPPVATTSPVLAPLERGEVRAALAERRAATVARFLVYREARVYPVNDYLPGFLHVWVDRAQHLCAAATMISKDWGVAATARIADENRFVRLADVHDGPIADWMLTSGLTHHELVAIQGAASFEKAELEPRVPTETERMHILYVDVERQLRQLWDESLDEATDALLAHPSLARALIAGVVPGPGKYAEATPTPVPAPSGAPSAPRS